MAGQVEAIGQDVTAFKPGDEVFGDLTQFGYGAFAATVPQAAILALQHLRGAARIGPGHKVLINGASGSVGQFAVQGTAAG